MPKEAQLEHVAQGHGQVDFEHFQGWKLHNLSTQSVPVFS